MIYSNKYFEYLLGDLGYFGESMFIIRILDTHEQPLDANDIEITTYNKIYADYHVQVEWKIGGLNKSGNVLCIILMPPKYNHLFQAYALLINIFHLRKMDIRHQVVGDHDDHPQNHGWASDY